MTKSHVYLHKLTYPCNKGWRTLKCLVSEHLCLPYITGSRAFLSSKVTEMTWGSCAVFMCPPLATQDSILGCPLLAHRQVVSLFVCFSLSRLVQACSCSCSNSAQCSLNLALPSSILSQLHQRHYWFCPFLSAELTDIKGVCACLWAEGQFVNKIKPRVIKGM